MTIVPAPRLGSLLLATRDAERLGAWYRDAFGVEPDHDGFLHFGGTSILIDTRDDVAAGTAEPGRVICNYEVDDIAAAARHLDGMGVSWVAPVEYREDAGAWFGTVADPDGNLVQLIQLTPAYGRSARAGDGLARAALRDAEVAVRLPAQDLARARRFYADKLGLEPAETREGGLKYVCGRSSFVVFASTGRPSGEHTQMGFYVPDITSAVAELRDRGVEFEQVDMGDLPVNGVIVDIPGNYPSTGAVGERAAWFRDSEGNLLGLGQLVMPGSADAAADIYQP
jgi:catechol 2,3-dioxygenase-like lactoylglutathione lyase family enzyme